MSTLLPCPFCGKVPVSRFVGDDDGGYHGIDCCRAFSHDATEEEAAAGWNRRADLTPADLAASVAAAAEAMREACEQAACDASDPPALKNEAEGQIADDTREMVMDAIRALPIPSADALARRDAEMRREGMLKAAWIAENIHPSAASAVGEAHMRSYRDAITYAIRALAAEAGHD